MSSWYVESPKKSLGNILHFLYYCCNFDVAEDAMIGSRGDGGFVEYWGKEIATFTYDEEGFPVFSFVDQPGQHNSGMQDSITRWRNNYEENREKAIKDWKDYHAGKPK